MNANRSSVAELASKPAGAFFHWEAPGEPIAVHFHLNIVDLLERNVLRGGDKGAAGVLLGRIENGRQPTLIVEDCEPIQVPALHGPSDSPFGDRDVWESVLDRWHSIPGKRISILGFYRSCAPGQATLNEHDLAILGSNPTKSEQIFLIIEPGAGKPCSGILFMARDGAEVWRWNAVPFNRKELARRRHAQYPAHSNSQHPSIQLPETVVAEELEPRQRPERGPAASLLRWILGFLAGVALVAVGLLSLRGGRLLQPLSNAFATGTESGLELRVQRSGNDLQLSWNRNAPILLKATAGRLSIADGSIHKNLDLDLSELRSGSILYSPITDNAVLRLDVLGAGSATTSESVRIVAGLLPPLPAQFQISNAAPPSAPRLADSPRQISAAVAALKGSLSPGVSSPTSNGPPPAQSGPSQPSVESFSAMPSPNTPLRAASTTPPSLPAPMPPELEMRASAPFVELPSVAPPAPRVVDQNEQFEPARLISGKDPVYPPSARQVQVSGTVEVSFHIGADGTVRNFTSVKGPPMLVQPVLDAVQARRYEPARLNGNAVDSELSVVFVFKLN
jgi:protein TonB